MSRFFAFLRRPLFGTTSVPAGARVNPDLFDDAAFPVTCPHCTYLLQGLPEPRCPECGQPFDRGRLLVEQYVTREAPSWQAHPTRRKRAALLAVAAFALIVARPVGEYLLILLRGSGPALWSQIELYGRICTVVGALLFAGMAMFGLLEIRHYRRHAERRAAILQALRGLDATPAESVHPNRRTPL